MRYGLAVQDGVVINGVSLLETELSNRKTNHVMLVYFHAPPRQEIKDRHRPRDARTKVSPHAMAHVLAINWLRVLQLPLTSCSL